MKYDYITKKGPLKNWLLSSSNSDRLMDETNKIIIKEIDSEYHVLEYINGVYEFEKKILNDSELIDYLIEKNSYDVYFFGCSKEKEKNIARSIRKHDSKLNLKQHEPKVKYIYTIEGDKVLKTSAAINREVVENSVLELFDHVYDFNRVTLSGLMNHNNLFKEYNLPYVTNREGDFLIPSSSNKEIDLLNRILCNQGEKIYLNNYELSDLLKYEEASKDRPEINKILKKVVSKIDVDVKKEYSLEDFRQAVSFMDAYNKEEGNFISSVFALERKLYEAESLNGAYSKSGIKIKEKTLK